VMNRVLRLLLALAAVLVGVGTTTIGAATHSYDVPTIARVDAHGVEAAETRQVRPGGLRDGSFSPSVETRQTSTTPHTRRNATDRAGMDSFLDNGSTVSHSGTATAIGDDANTLTNFGRSQGSAGHDVIVHGQVVDGQASVVTNGMPTHTQQIADAVLSNPAYVRGSPVQLVTCHGACGLADELFQALGGARVTASPYRVDLDPATGLLRSWK
jgi:hypothetical protein